MIDVLANNSTAHQVSGRYEFKRAASADEFDQIRRLNHQVFVDEVGQHEATDSGRLIDRFESKSIYFIAQRGDVLAGMISVHDEPPFSISGKLSDSSVLTKLGSRLLEVRLLAIQPNERHTAVFAGLLYAVFRYAAAGRYSHLLISGLQERRTMYERLGFRALGPAVGSGNAQFIPMAVELGRIPVQTIERFRKRAEASHPLQLAPGPVQVSRAVRCAFSTASISHRCDTFTSTFEEVRGLLQNLSGGLKVALFPGSGTLANDVVGAAISADRLRRRGLVLANGEFGERLIQHAVRWRLPHRVVHFPWGQRWDFSSISETLGRYPDIDWIWAVQLETSTGMVNDTGSLFRLAEQRGMRVYLDCVSGFGAAELDIRPAALATTVSSKSIGGYTGAAIVLANEQYVDQLDSKAFPPCFDLVRALANDGPLTTFSSQVIQSLRQALIEQGPEKWAHYRALGMFVRKRLNELGLHPVVEGADAAPVVTSFAAPRNEPCTAILDRCAKAGFVLGGNSKYLMDRGWLQIATMGDLSIEQVSPVFPLLR